MNTEALDRFLAFKRKDTVAASIGNGMYLYRTQFPEQFLAKLIKEIEALKRAAR